MPALPLAPIRLPPFAWGIGLAAGALALSALAHHRAARRAETRNPPRGRFVEVDGTSIHYVERGRGQPLILLHGNGSMVQDFESSGLIELAAENYRVIAFDRPGFGHSERPRNVVWTPTAQASLIAKALAQLGVSRPIVLGHSWGASVALALGLQHPETVGCLVLASGYYYPTARADVVALAPPAFPVVGDVMRYTISPLLGRLLWPLFLQKIFGPAPVPRKFRLFPKGLALRPSQIRASAAESALMIPGAMSARSSYDRLHVPTIIIAGREDRLVNTDRQSARLHAELPHSKLLLIRGAGHMVHQTATTAVLHAINLARDEIAKDGATRGGRKKPAGGRKRMARGRQQRTSRSASAS